LPFVPDPDALAVDTVSTRELLDAFEDLRTGADDYAVDVAVPGVLLTGSAKQVSTQYRDIRPHLLRCFRPS